MKTKTTFLALISVLLLTKSHAQIDSIAPVIYLNTPYSICHQQNYAYYSQPISYSDNYYPANQLTVSKTGQVNPFLKGWYEETYTVTDGSGNSSSKTRHIVVGNCGKNPKTNLVKGFVYLDNDSNCFYNPLKDRLIDNLNVNISGVDYNFMNSAGHFQFYADSAIKVVTPRLPEGWKVKCPAGGKDTWDIAEGGDLYFALVPIPKNYNTNIDNLIKSASWNGQVVVRGNNAQILQNIANFGNTKSDSIHCKFSADRKLSYIKHPFGNNIYNTTGTTFIIPGLPPLGKTSFIMEYAISTSDSGFVKFNCSCWTKSNLNELDPSNNSSDLKLKIVYSHDPNDKQGMAMSETNTGIDDLEYFVRFQNTGTWPATNVIVRDTLSPLLDTNTFRFISASHTAYVERTGYALAFHFVDIELADSAHNEPESHGWFYYNIKPNPGLQEKQRIHNTAYIYFDAEDAVVTNTTSNFWEIPKANLAFPVLNNLHLYPVPAGDVLHFNFAELNSGPSRISIFASSGKKILDIHKELSDKVNSLDVSLLPQGIYFLQLTQKGRIYTEKFSIRR